MENKERILSFIKEQSGWDHGTTKKRLYKEFKDLEHKEVDKLIKELKDEGEISLEPLWNMQTGMLCGSGYMIPQVF